MQEHLHQDTALQLPPPVPEAVLVDAAAPEMRHPQKLMWSSDGLRGALVVEKLSKNVVSTPFVPSLIDSQEDQSVVETLLPAGANRAFAVVEQRRADLGVLSPYPEVTPARRDDAGVDLDLTWAVSQEREIDPKQTYFYKMKELETFIRHDALKVKAEKDTVAKAKLFLGLQLMKEELARLNEICGPKDASNTSSTSEMPVLEPMELSEAPAPSNAGTYAPPASPLPSGEADAEELDVGEEIDSFLEQDGPR